jgi:hypothetical protein
MLAIMAALHYILVSPIQGTAVPKTEKAPGRESRLLRWLGVLWLAMYFAARLLLKNLELPTGVRVGIALMPVPVFALYLWQAVRSIRGADEFERQVHLEALAVAFPLTLLLLTTLALMQRAVFLNPEDWGYAHIWIYLPLFYLGGLALARKRYS